MCGLLVAFTIGIAGCSRPVATVNGRPVDNRTFDVLLKERIEAAGPQDPPADLRKLKEIVLNDLITEALMFEDAAKKGISVTEAEAMKEVQEIRKSMGEDAFRKALRDKGISVSVFSRRTREKLMISRFTESLLSGVSVSDEEVRRYYAESPKPFIKPTKVLMSMIEFGTEAEAKTVITEMRSKKAEFDDVARELAARNRATVSDYGWVNPDMFSAALSSGVRNLRNGQYGGPYVGKQKFYLVRVIDREKEMIASFDEMKDTIRNTLMEERRQMAFAHWLAQKRRDAKVEVNL